jgi:Lrp/AsnC family leucine-responsive transcriptional regulator
MVDIDLKDRKILYQLDLNCRQSNAQIGKKVGLSKQVVDYRIKRMEEEGIITGYWTCIDSYRFGYQVYRYYLITQNATSSKKDEMILYIADYKNIWVACGLKGNYDISVIIWVKNMPEFYHFWDKFNEKYGDYITDKIFSVYLEADVYPLSFLLGDEFPKKDRENPQHTGLMNPISISKEDAVLLKEIVNNARISLVDLAEKLHCSSQAAHYRLKQLQDKGIIQGFHVESDISKLGYEHYKVDIWLKEISKRKEIWRYIRENPHVTFINTSAGYSDLEVEFEVESLDKLLYFMEEVQAKFLNSIRKFIYFSRNPNQIQKLRCLPELTEEDFKKQ